ncbi:MAG: hypothetical protein ACYDIE_06750 [Candidatus Krumholzibacteriia bacterium]
MRSGKLLSLAALLALAVTGALLGGCSQDGNEFQRLVCEVSLVNAGTPLVSGYVDAGADRVAGTPDDTFPIDIVSVNFHARPYSEAVILTPESPYSYFHITSYDLTWVPLTADGDSLVNYNRVDARTELLVPVNDDATVPILIADRSMKDRPWFAELLTGSRPSFTAIAEIRFHGHETGSETDIVVPASLMVTFVGVIISN